MLEKRLFVYTDVKLIRGTNFLSHPKYESNPLLYDHLSAVAKNIDGLLSKININDEIRKYAHFAGLLHDLGKLDPVYQYLFDVDNRGELQEREKKAQNRQHAIYSAWIMYNLLHGRGSLPFNQAITIVASHHTKLNAPSNRMRYEISKELCENLKKFVKISQVSSINEVCLPISFQGITLTSASNQGNYKDFLDINTMFSALLQADRGSFGNRSVRKEFVDRNGTVAIDFCTENLSKGGKLSKLRTKFQDYVLKKVDVNKNVVVIEAPTGVGKTKAFLDILKKYKEKERVIYFSPLLSLSDDFEEKIGTVIKPGAENDILEYNSVYSGKLSNKDQNDGDYLNRVEQGWFDIEAFNYPFVITTTQRLLITLFSNYHKDKLKFLSLANSVLVIDEVQVVPAFLLKPLIKMLYELSEKLNSKVLILSATIPYAIKQMPDLSIINPPPEIIRPYREATKKNIKYVEEDYDALLSCIKHDKKTLIMFNTRKKSLRLAKICHEKGIETKYVTSGIRKCDRETIIKGINDGEKATVISTQTLEAGVDLDFYNILREIAPLDSIVQVMGRLNREANSREATLVVFKIPNDNSYWLPYKKYHVLKSQEFLRNIKDSNKLYDELANYYKEIYENNQSERNDEQDLEDSIIRVDFDGIYSKVRQAFEDEYGDTVFVPRSKEEYDSMQREFSDNKTTVTKAYKRYAKTQAKLPSTIAKLDFKRHLDPELLESGVFLLKNLNEYDARLGFDIQIDKLNSKDVRSRMY